MRSFLAIVLACLLALAAAAPQLAPLHPAAKGSKIVPGKYVVMLKTSALKGKDVKKATTDATNKVTSAINVQPLVVYQRLGGFAAKLTDNQVKKIRENTAVDFVEPVIIVNEEKMIDQTKAPWGLARLSSGKTKVASNGGGTFRYDSTAGSGTCSYVLDTGIEASHPEFQGRAQQVVDFIGSTNVDDNGHGTHVAGIIGSKTYGVAKQTMLYGVKVLDHNGVGESYMVIAGLDFALSDSRNRNCPKGVVVNTSLGCWATKALNNAADNVVNANVFLVTSAGNRGMDAKYRSPASSAKACTIGAAQDADVVPAFCNYGSVLDLYAPGVDILSTWIGGGTRLMTGTSFAAPYVAGIGAYYMGLGRSSGGNMCTYLKNRALRGILYGVPNGTPNLYVQM